MDLISFLNYALIAAGLIVVFRNFDERSSQYLAILCIGLSALLLFGRAGLIPFPSAWKIGVIFPAAAALLSLVVVVRIAEKSFALLMLAMAGIQILVGTEVIRSLR